VASGLNGWAAITYERAQVEGAVNVTMASAIALQAIVKAMESPPPPTAALVRRSSHLFRCAFDKCSYKWFPVKLRTFARFFAIHSTGQYYKKYNVTLQIARHYFLQNNINDYFESIGVDLFGWSGSAIGSLR
jgi:hypothetical protein